MQAHGFGSATPDDCYAASDSPDPSHHDCLDGRGGLCLSFGGVDRAYPALLAFGGDSTIELLSAWVVLWRFREQSRPEPVERQAARIAGAQLFAVAACVAV